MPSRLIRFREFKIKKQCELDYDCWTKDVIVFKRLEQVLEVWEAGLIECPCDVDPKDCPAYLERIWTRDRLRLRKAKMRAQTLGKHDTEANVLHMMRCDAGLGGESHELEDLLEYLAYFVYLFTASHIRNFAGKLVPPFIAGPTTYHCSRNGDWQRTVCNP